MGGKSQKKGQRGLQLLCSKGHREEQLEMDGSLSYVGQHGWSQPLFSGEGV